MLIKCTSSFLFELNSWLHFALHSSVTELSADSAHSSCLMQCMFETFPGVARLSN